VLPSYSENYGFVIAEAMASAVPVITTISAPWAEVELNRCGRRAGPGIEPLIQILKKAVLISETEHRAMGLRDRKLVEQRSQWKNIARNMITVYE
jgi:glycosyltransferase involved in cell wall biosynthesis